MSVRQRTIASPIERADLNTGPCPVDLTTTHEFDASRQLIQKGRIRIHHIPACRRAAYTRVISHIFHQCKRNMSMSSFLMDPASTRIVNSRVLCRMSHTAPRWTHHTTVGPPNAVRSLKVRWVKRTRGNHRRCVVRKGSGFRALLPLVRRNGSLRESASHFAPIWSSRICCVQTRIRVLYSKGHEVDHEAEDPDRVDEYHRPKNSGWMCSKHH
ncbi:hypothetical protein EDB83DRAFT_1833895 [Lactarius deliciosus]|nr:hypothetical protein EDB83DRAFT_1833895 [Lactarius deliciosus]